MRQASEMATGGRDQPLTVREFNTFAEIIFDQTGIQMQEKKMSLIAGRLARRLHVLACSSYGEYLERLKGDSTGEELAILIDLVTTHVTHFFREPEHFVYLGKLLSGVQKFPFRVWCAAASTGEEAFSAALILRDRLGSGRWEVLGTDVSAGSIARARAGLYPMTGSTQIPDYYLKHFCLKGQDSVEGYFTFQDSVRAGVRFDVLNLLDFRQLAGGFCPDIVFLRNVMIYFDRPRQQEILDRVGSVMPKGGILMVGHSESLATFRSGYRLLKTAIYEKS